MKKINTAPISGMQELLPDRQVVFDDLKEKIEKIYKKHGFWKIETPTLERTEILLAKAGGETEKQIYFVRKTDDNSEADEALRFDHTVPLARYVVEHANDLPFPFKVTQIGRNFRGERAQKGRFREFYQCDVDIIGREKLPVFYDAEIITVLSRALAVFGLEDLVVRINNRKIVAGFLEILDLAEMKDEISGIIDKAEKVDLTITRQNLLNLGIAEQKVSLILDFIQIKGDGEEVERSLNKLVDKICTNGVKNDIMSEGIKEIVSVLRTLEKQNLPVKARGDMMIIRGLDYYTGTVFEVFVDSDRSLGSLCGGGRYENLTGYFSEQKYPGVGGSIGLTRLFSVLSRKNLIEGNFELQKRLAIIPISENEIDYALQVAEEKRAEGTIADIIMTDKKLSDKLKYAAKIADEVIVLGEEERQSRKFEIRTLK